MFYHSTRGQAEPHSLPEAILSGLASDGGLFFPEKIPTVTPEERKKIQNSSFSEIATTIFKKFSNDFTETEIQFAAESAYSLSHFPHEKVAPIRQLDRDLFILELFRGPTGAFKDFALQFLPRLMAISVEKGGNKDQCILVATSGDTGGAALAGFADVPKTTAIIFFPNGGVSALQKAQMQNAPGKNITSIEMTGDFDLAQAGVKEIFSDPNFNKEIAEEFGVHLSSANSINIGRLLPQIFYSFSAYAQMVKEGCIKDGEEIDICVPTGNFGNIFSSYLAKEMGLPIGKFICASNPNDTSSKFLQSGTFDVRGRKTEKTISPAMDILRASNLERLLYAANGKSGEQILEWQSKLLEKGHFTVDKKTIQHIQKDFEGATINDQETAKEISDSFFEYDFLPDPHTAIAIKTIRKKRKKEGERKKTLIFSTAHYGKFGETVFKSLFPEEKMPNAEAKILEKLASITRSPQIPEHFFKVLSEKRRHTDVCEGSTDAMKKKVKEFLRKKYSH